MFFSLLGFFVCLSCGNVLRNFAWFDICVSELGFQMVFGSFGLQFFLDPKGFQISGFYFCFISDSVEFETATVCGFIRLLYCGKGF